jgi:hypothetical protein
MAHHHHLTTTTTTTATTTTTTIQANILHSPTHYVLKRPDLTEHLDMNMHKAEQQANSIYKLGVFLLNRL